jgi:hypothetical protein
VKIAVSAASLTPEISEFQLHEWVRDDPDDSLKTEFASELQAIAADLPAECCQKTESGVSNSLMISLLLYLAPANPNECECAIAPVNQSGK